MRIYENGELERYEYTEAGYEPTMHYDAWRVAFLNFGEKFDVIDKLERHLLTDEVFVLLEGEAMLIVGEDCKVVRLEKNKIYNVKAGVWHATKVTEDGKVLVVENHSTSKDNSEHMALDKPLELKF